MSRQRALILPLFICAFLTATAQTPLQPGTPIERALGPNGSQEFTVNLEENTLIQFVVEQRGIDVIVRVSAPNGKPVGDFGPGDGDVLRLNSTHAEVAWKGQGDLTSLKGRTVRLHFQGNRAKLFSFRFE